MTTPKRVAIAPNLPTMMEAACRTSRCRAGGGLRAERYAEGRRQRLNTEIVKILHLPDVKEKLGTSLGMEIVGSTPDEPAAHMAKEIPRWAELSSQSGATAI